MARSPGTLALVGIDVPCAVTCGPEHEALRVLSRRRFQACLGMTHTAIKADDPATGLPYFIASVHRKGSIPGDLAGLLGPLWPRDPHRGLLAAVSRTLSTGKLALVGIDIPCAVIEGPDAEPLRVLSRKRFQACIGMHTTRTPRDNQETGMPYFMALENLKPYINNNLEELLAPLWYKEPHRGLLSAGYRAELLPAVCDLYVTAGLAGALPPSHMPIARRCGEILGAFAHVGIIALVDEATGYQEYREKDALQKLITLYLGATHAPWVRRFPHEFYALAYRLHGYAYRQGQTTHPGQIAGFTKRVIYDYLPDGVYTEMCERNPRVRGANNSWRLYKHHQFLTTEMGQRHIHTRLELALSYMRIADTHLPTFWFLLDQGKSRQAQTVLPFLRDQTLTQGRPTDLPGAAA
jgi:hypothetical protein